MIDKPTLIRKAFEADNANHSYSDLEYVEEVAEGKTDYLNPIVDAVIDAMTPQWVRLYSEWEIDILPDGTVIADKDDDIWQYRGGLWCTYETRPCGSERIAQKYQPITILRLGKP